ncbi:Beta-1,6-galactosyltransferase GALT31A [Citrus sinensis]|uniref:Beta-1,6-galactosyltransferase GALT31A n=1 Tax=Citrus sinensis TaxID=2711 RepID=A0ACB8M969_CITSI|nr:Beta-1,6-galactosyltransferase GALT31A [Citrus sinensis]
MEKGKGIVIRFVIGHSATPGGVLDKAIDAEDAEHQDFLTLNHVEGYHQLSSKTRLGVKYHEPEYWKFGEEGNKYIRHATGQIYAISKDLAAYISINLPILHRYANEDLSPLLTKFLDCEWKAKAGNACVASFDWSCSGICKSVERMKIGHNSCGEGDGAVWNVDF